MEAMTVRYPIGIQTFSEIIEGKYAYVDKTALVYQLANAGKYFFLSRPRRFGKSLLLSTLQAYFEGRRELFNGLAMEKLETQWKRYPVIMLSLSRYNPSEEGNLEDVLNTYFKIYEQEYKIDNISKDFSSRFHDIILGAYRQTGEKVVVLVDEYDAPMVAHLGQEDKHERVRNILKSVYVNLKEMDQYIKFGMLTGVSRFSKVTIFSGLNNLNDITLDPKYGEICGITESELKDNFKEGIEKFAMALETDWEGAVATLKENYDGYHFTEKSPDIYNPFSLINALSKQAVGSYWFVSGTPTFLIKQIWRNPGVLSKTFSERADGRMLSDIDSFQFNPVPLMFQTGYLTIKSYDSRRMLYTLGIPNREVEEGLFNGLLAANLGPEQARLMPNLWDIRDYVEEGNIEEALDRVKSILAAIPYSLTQDKPEIYFENNLFLLFKLIGVHTHAEWQTSRGRIDMLLETPDYVYVMELKLDGTAEQALAQIDTKEYAIPFKYDGRPIVKVGLNFSSETRNIDTWVIER